MRVSPPMNLHSSFFAKLAHFLLQANSFTSQKHPEHVIEEGSEVIFTVHM